MLHPFTSNKKQLSLPPQKMSASPLTIFTSDKEDAQIREHEVTIKKAKHAKEEQQRQWEEECQGNYLGVSLSSYFLPHL